jgi:hypothetical protein
MVFNSGSEKRGTVLQWKDRRDGCKSPPGLKRAGTYTRPAEPGNERARRISKDVSRALQVLGHATKYLTADFADLKTGPFLLPQDPRIEAVRILMLLNLEVYFDCPLNEPWVNRTWRALLGLVKHRNDTLAMHDSRH